MRIWPIVCRAVRTTLLPNDTDWARLSSELSHAELWDGLSWCQLNTWTGTKPSPSLVPVSPSSHCINLVTRRRLIVLTVLVITALPLHRLCSGRLRALIGWRKWRTNSLRRHIAETSEIMHNSWPTASWAGRHPPRIRRVYQKEQHAVFPTGGGVRGEGGAEERWLRMQTTAVVEMAPRSFQYGNNTRLLGWG